MEKVPPFLLLLPFSCLFGLFLWWLRLPYIFLLAFHLRLIVVLLVKGLAGPLVLLGSLLFVFRWSKGAAFIEYMSFSLLFWGSVFLICLYLMVGDLGLLRASQYLKSLVFELLNRIKIWSSPPSFWELVLFDVRFSYLPVVTETIPCDWLVG